VKKTVRFNAFRVEPELAEIVAEAQAGGASFSAVMRDAIQALAARPGDASRNGNELAILRAARALRGTFVEDLATVAEECVHDADVRAVVRRLAALLRRRAIQTVKEER
jgi:hypothetical protein